MSDEKPSEQDDLEILAYELLRARKTLDDAQHVVGVIEGEIMGILENKGATLADSPSYIISRKDPPRQYVWDEDAIIKLRSLLPEWHDIVEEVSTLKVDTRKLLAVAAKRGTEIRGIVEAGHHIIMRGSPHIKVEVKKDGHDSPPKTD